MQDDLVDAAQRAIDQGIDGGSYGGYASAMELLRDPGLLKAGIIEHAMLDLAYQSQYPPHSWGVYYGLWERYFSDIDRPEDVLQMHQRSPINLVDKMQAAALIMAGKSDRFVGFERTKIFISKALDKNIDTLIIENEGYWIGKWPSKVKRARRVDKFRAEHLGGHSVNWDWIEPVAAYLGK